MSEFTKSVFEHRARVAHWLQWICNQLHTRALLHDQSKLNDPEKSIYEENLPALKSAEFGSEDYKKVLDKMSRGIKHHYSMNMHHPEFYENGIDGMDIVDLVEMLADWMSAASEKESAVNLDYLSERFSISPQLRSIIENTLRSADEDADNNKIDIGFRQVIRFI